jgi:acyl transferase domain-containing protein
MLSTIGRCATFDATADGFRRGEGCASVVLSHQSTNPPMKGTICGTGVNQDGRSASLTAPHGPSQNAVHLAALRDAALEAQEIAVSECHGTGTALGDPIEVGSLRSVYGKGTRSHPLTLGAFKSNFGHTEGAAGLSGFIKCILKFMSARGPPNIHLRVLNPHLEVYGFNSILPTECCGLA